MSATTRRLDDNLDLVDGAVRCRHCGATVGSADKWLANARVRQSPWPTVGTRLPTHSATYVDEAIVHRQAFCPGCYTVLQTEVLPEKDIGLRSRRIS